MGLNYSFVQGEAETGKQKPREPEPIKGAEEEKTLTPKTFDLESVRALFKSYDPEFQALKKKADALEIKTDADAETATDMIAQGSKFIKTLEAKRKDVTNDADGYVRGVQSIVRGTRVQAEGIVKEVKRKLGAYQYKKELDRREDEKKAREAAAAAQKDLDAQAKEMGVESVKIPEMQVPKKRDPVRTESGTASTLMVWDFEITDPAKVPDNYKDINPGKVKSAIAAGIREIPGVKIFERPDVRVRTN